MNVLIVSDSENFNNYLAIFFLKEGIKPIKIINEEKINSQVKNNNLSIDLAIIDVDSKNYNGIHILNEIIKNQLKIYLIVITAKTHIEFVKKLSKMGVFGIVCKNNTINEQLKNLTNILNIIKTNKSEKRKFIRVKPLMEDYNSVQLTIEGLKIIYLARVINISHKGLTISFNNFMSKYLFFKGALINLTIKLENYVLESKALIVLRKSKYLVVIFKAFSQKSKSQLFKYILSRV